MARKRVSFTTRQGERVSFVAGKRSSTRTPRTACVSCGPRTLFRKGSPLPRPKGLRKGDIIKVRGKRGLYMVMKDELKPVRVEY